MKLIKFVVILFVVTTFTNCTIQKRSYRDGYYVSWNKKAIQTPKTDTKTEITKSVISEVKINAITQETNEPLFASADKAIQLKMTTIKIKPLQLEKDSCGDLITLRDGTEISAKVMEVSADEIKYKRCDNLGGPLIVTAVKNVFMIKYVSGVKEIYKDEDQNKQVENQITEALNTKPKVFRENNNWAIASLVNFGLFFLIVTIPISLACGIIAIIQHKNAERRSTSIRFKNMWMAYIPVFIIALFLLLFLFTVFL